MEKSNKMYWIYIVIGALLVIAGCIMIYLKTNDNGSELLWTNESYNPETVHRVLLEDDNLYVDDELIAQDIQKYIDVTLGSDVCEGNRFIVLLMNDSTISSLSIDYLSCSDTVAYQENINNLKNITNIYSKLSSAATTYEPAFYDVYAVDENNNEYLITDYLLEQ